MKDKNKEENMDGCDMLKAWPKYYVFLVLFTIFQFDLEKFIGKNWKYIIFYQKFVHFGQKYF